MNAINAPVFFNFLTTLCSHGNLQGDLSKLCARRNVVQVPDNKHKPPAYGEIKFALTPDTAEMDGLTSRAHWTEEDALTSLVTGQEVIRQPSSIFIYGNDNDNDNGASKDQVENHSGLPGLLTCTYNHITYSTESIYRNNRTDSSFRLELFGS